MLPHGNQRVKSSSPDAQVRSCTTKKRRAAAAISHAPHKRDAQRAGGYSREPICTGARHSMGIGCPAGVEGGERGSERDSATGLGEGRLAAQHGWERAWAPTDPACRGLPNENIQHARATS